jgi:hypothetical protein
MAQCALLLIVNTGPPHRYRHTLPVPVVLKLTRSIHYHFLTQLSALVQPKHGDRTELQGSRCPHPRLYAAHSFLCNYALFVHNYRWAVFKLPKLHSRRVAGAGCVGAGRLCHSTKLARCLPWIAGFGAAISARERNEKELMRKLLLSLFL